MMLSPFDTITLKPHFMCDLWPRLMAASRSLRASLIGMRGTWPFLGTTGASAGAAGMVCEWGCGWGVWAAQVEVEGGCGRRMGWGRGVGSREGRGRRRRVVCLGKRWHGTGRGRGGASGTAKGSLGRGNERRRWRRSRRYEILSMLRLLTTEIQTEKRN